MSITNDELIEEILWKSHQLGLYNEVMERATQYISQGVRKSFAYSNAYKELVED